MNHDGHELFPKNLLQSNRYETAGLRIHFPPLLAPLFGFAWYFLPAAYLNKSWWLKTYLGWEFIKEKKKVNRKVNTHASTQKRTRSRKHALVQESVHAKKNSGKKTRMKTRTRTREREKKNCPRRNEQAKKYPKNKQKN